MPPGSHFSFSPTSPEYEDFQGKFTSEEECLQDLIIHFLLQAQNMMTFKKTSPVRKNASRISFFISSLQAQNMMTFKKKFTSEEECPQDLIFHFLLQTGKLLPLLLKLLQVTASFHQQQV